MGREEMEHNARSSADPCYTEPNSRVAEEKRPPLAVLSKLLHHGFFGMILSVALTLVSFFAKIARSVLGGRVTDLIMRLISWFLCRGGNATPVTSVSFVNFLDDNFEIRGTGFPVHSNTLTATNAEVLILASKLAYENMSDWVRVVIQVWEMEWIAGYSFEPQGTQVFVFKHKTAIVVAFRGTEPFNLFDWLVDLEFALKAPQGTDKNPDRALLGKVHAGFYDALMTPPNCRRSIPCYRVISADGITTEMGLRDESRPPYDIVRDRIMEELHRDKDLYVFVTGHSLGAALASVFCAHLLVDEDPENLVKPRVQLLCTFGQPRTGGYKFARFLDCMASTRMTSMNGEDGKPIGFRYLRFVNNNDIVPRLPPPVRFSHSPCFIFLNNLGYEEVGCETEGLSVAGVIVDEVMSRCLRTIQLPLNCVLDLASFNLTKPIVRFVVFLLPNLIYNHFPSEYERVIRGCPDPYFDEDQWVATKWQVPLLG